MSKEQRKLWNKRAYEKRKLSENPEPERISEPKETGFPEHRAYEEFMQNPKDIDQKRYEEKLRRALNPKLMVKRNADNPEAYGEKGVLICSIHGCPLGKRGCPVCNGEEC